MKTEFLKLILSEIDVILSKEQKVRVCGRESEGKQEKF